MKRIGNVGNWRVAVHRVERAYNGCFHSGVNASPSEVFWGRKKDGVELSTEAWNDVKEEALRATQEARRKRAERF